MKHLVLVILGLFKPLEKNSPIKQFGKTFWATNLAEVFERAAWYGFAAVGLLYLTSPVSEGGLGLAFVLAGMILGISPFFLYLFPLVSAALGTRYGYKKVLLLSFLIMSIGYYSCSLATGFYSFFACYMMVALGAGMFKPMVTSTVAQVTKNKPDLRALGFTIFYVVVNIGGFLGPIIGAYFRPSIGDGGVLLSGSWKTLFYLSSGYMTAMFFWILFMYKEPNKVDDTSKPFKVMEMITDLKDLKLSFLLIILIGFWGTFLTFYYIMPSWVSEWVNTSSVASLMSDKFVSGGNIKGEMIVNLNSMFIIFFGVLIGSFFKKMNPLKVITSGTLLLCLAVGLFSLSSPYSGGSLALLFLFPPIILFSVGELMSSPKSQELMAVISPTEKIATYQSYMFLSVAGGFLLAGWLSGLYGKIASKAEMYKHVLIDSYSYSKDAVQNLNLEGLAHLLTENGVNIEVLNQQLWNTHHPYTIWLITVIPGVLCVLFLLIYLKFVPSLGKKI